MPCPDWVRKDMSKTGSGKVSTGIKDIGSLFHGPRPAHYADGGEVLKQEGLKASNAQFDAMSGKDKALSSFKRLFEGNIDDPNSEAYKKYGAGRGAAEANRNAPSYEQTEDYKNLMPKSNVTEEQRKKAEADTEVSPMEMVQPKASTAPKASTPAPKAAPKKKAATPKAPPVAPAKDEAPAESRRLERESTRANRVPPRPKMNWSTPGDRAAWDKKYKDKYNADGSPK